MQVTETQTDGLKREFKVLVAAKDIDEKISGRLRELGGKIKVPGFRPGKVPLDVLKKRFGKSIMGEVLEHAVNDSSTQAINERGLRPAVQPKIEITAFDEGKDLEYTMALELLPEFEPMDFSTLVLERDVIEAGEADVERALADMAGAHKKTKPLEKPRKSRKGDVLVLDFKGTVDGEEYPGMSAEDHHLELGSSSFIEGFEDQLIGAAVGDVRQVELKFPAEYVNDRLAGRDAVFEVTIKGVLELVLPEIDNDFAVSLGQKDLAALEASVREGIEAEYRALGRSRLKRRLLDRLAEAHDFPVPQSMVAVEFDAIWKQVEEDRERGGSDPEDAGKSEDELKAEYRKIAERRVRLGLLVSEVGRRNAIEVTPDEVKQAAIRAARQYPGKEREILELYQKTPEALANLRAPIFEDKVVDFIIGLAKVTERRMTSEEILEEMKDGARPGEAPAKKAGG